MILRKSFKAIFLSNVICSKLSIKALTRHSKLFQRKTLRRFFSIFKLKKSKKAFSSRKSSSSFHVNHQFWASNHISNRFHFNLHQQLNFSPPPNFSASDLVQTIFFNLLFFHIKKKKSTQKLCFSIKASPFFRPEKTYCTNLYSF